MSSVGFRVSLFDVKFCEDQIGAEFSDGQSIFKRDNSHAQQPLKIVEFFGKFYALDNKALMSKHLHDHQITEVELVPLERFNGLEELLRKVQRDETIPNVIGMSKEQNCAMKQHIQNSREQHEQTLKNLKQEKERRNLRK